MARKKGTTKKPTKKKAKGNRRGRQLGASKTDLAKARAAGKRQGKTGGRPKLPPTAKEKPEPVEIEPELEKKILDAAEHGVETEDIARILKIGKRLGEDTDFRAQFESLVDFGHARLREKVARKICDDAIKGAVTPLKEMAEAWLERHMDEAPMRDFASGTADRLHALIEKARASLKDRQEKRKAEKKKKKTKGPGSAEG